MFVGCLNYSHHPYMMVGNFLVILRSWLCAKTKIVEGYGGFRDETMNHIQLLP